MSPPELDPAAQIADAVRAIWDQRRREVIARVDVLEEAIVEALSGNLEDELRERARREAHRLAGAAGTFGFPAASTQAREIELALAGGPPEQDTLPRLADLVLALRSELEAGPAGRRPAADQPASAAAPAATPTRPVDLLVIGVDLERAHRIADEAEVRGLGAAVAGDHAAAREHLRTPPGVVVLEAGGDDPLVMLEEAASRAPTIVLAAPGTVDRVEVARRGGRRLLARESTIAEIVDAAAGLRERLRREGTSVLCVDDDTAVLETLDAILSRAGLRVETCGDPARFWEQLEREAPDLVLLDYDMPGITGAELARAMRNDGRYQTVPIMFLTARADPESIRRIFDAGADDYVTKPFAGPELLARISNRLERVRLFRALADTDPLTGLANRRRSTAAISALLSLAGRTGEPVQLAVLGIDGYEQIKERHGYDIAESVMRAVGSTQARAFRGEDVVSRWEADEFVIGMYGMRSADARERVGALLESIRGRELAPRVCASLSVGLAESPGDGSDVEALHRAATGALVRARAAGGDRVMAACDAAEQGTPRLDVVVVEDDDTLAALLEHSFKTRGYGVRVISDGAQALAELGGADPRLAASVILLDWNLPGLDGMRVLRAMAAAGVLVRSRVIMLTARATEEEVLAALDAGAVDHVTKPFSVPVLMQRVRRAMER